MKFLKKRISFFNQVFVLFAAILISGCTQNKDLLSFKQAESQIDRINLMYYSLYYAHPHEKNFDINIKWRAVNTAFLEGADTAKTELVKNLSFILSWNVLDRSISVVGKPDGLNRDDSAWLDLYSLAMKKLLDDYIADLRLFFRPVIVPMKGNSGYKINRTDVGTVVEAHYFESNSKIVSTFDTEMLLKNQKSYEISSGKLFTDSDVSYTKYEGLLFIKKIVTRKPQASDSSDFVTREFFYDFSNRKFPLKRITIKANKPRSGSAGKALSDDMMEFSVKN